MSTLIVVSDMEVSKKFYCDILGLHITSDFGSNVTVLGGIVLQTLSTWTQFIQRSCDSIIFSNLSGELYFEVDDIDSFFSRISCLPDVKFLHPLIEHSWGQRVSRVFDPDDHIIEIGEDMKAVIKRFMDSGMSCEDTAKRMDVPLDYIKATLYS